MPTLISRLALSDNTNDLDFGFQGDTYSMEIFELREEGSSSRTSASSTIICPFVNATNANKARKRIVIKRRMVSWE